MRKLFLILLLLLPGIAAAQQLPDFSKVEIKVAKVSGNVYMLQGAGGNIAASLGDDGILIVDTEYSALADKVRAALKNIGTTDKPARFVIDTHYHSDHSDGNAAYAEGGAIIIANENLRKRLENGSAIGNGPGGSISMKQPAQPKAALPVDHLRRPHQSLSEWRGDPRIPLPCRAHGWRFRRLFCDQSRRPHGRRIRSLRIPFH